MSNMEMMKVRLSSAQVLNRQSEKRPFDCVWSEAISRLKARTVYERDRGESTSQQEQNKKGGGRRD